MALSNGIKNLIHLFDRNVSLATQEPRARSRPKTKELTPLDPYIGMYFKYLLNPDKILKYKSGGRGVELYSDIIDKDAHVRSCFKIRKNALMSLGYEIQPYTQPGQEDPLDEDVNRAQQMQEILSRMKNFRRNIREILSAFEHGYSVNEIRYKIDPPYVIIEELKSRDPNKFVYDNEFNLCYVGKPGETIKLDPMYFVQFTYEPRFENPYGTSDLKTVFWPWWFKTNLMKYLVKFSERFGQPTIVGKYPHGWSQEQQEALLAELESIQDDTVGVTEEGTQFEMLEPKNRNEGLFIEGMRFFDQQISKAILGNTLSTDQGDGSGSYALGKVHEGVRLDLLESDAGDLESCLQDQIINRLSYYNFGPDVMPPRIKIPFKEPEDLEKLARTYKELAGFKVEFPKRHIHKKFDIPMPAEDEEVYGGGSTNPNPFMPTGGLPFKDMRFKTVDTLYFGKLIGRVPMKFENQFDIANALYFYDDLARVVRRIYREIQTALFAEIDVNSPMFGLIDQIVRQVMTAPENETLFASYIEKTASTVAQSMGTKFGLGKLESVLSERIYKQIADDYLMRNFYGKGKLQGIAETMQNILKSKIPEWRDIGYEFGKMKKILSNTFVDLKDWKIHQIAQTELSQAAHYAAFEMIDRTGLQFDAYFFVDPASCPICQEWASNNPYTVEEARNMGLPHIQCNDQWSFVLKET